VLSLLVVLSLAIPGGPPGYVGRQACAGCHAPETALHAGSHHDLAMQPATPETVLGAFDGRQLVSNGITSTFLRRDGTYLVRTDGPDGALHDYPVAHTFGVTPLQQYLVEMPDGRLQALSLCWDSRPAAEGGQRWFHLYPDERIDVRDPLHWTAPAQNWNYMCAACHSTGLRRNYDAAARRFDTQWAEIDVSCEACHGPGAAHVAWAAKPEGERGAEAGMGLTVDLTPRGGTWGLADGAPIAALSAPRTGRTQIETCGRCHARAAQIAEEDARGQALAQTHLVAELDEGLYHPDGQIQGEVYEYGSFLQSRMFAAGVVCSDCHDAHSGGLRAEGNGLCAPCHRAAAYDTPAHHHHTAGGEAARCTSCHMLARDFMVIDRRHDHSFRVPRPDLSAALGTPDTCTDCHRDRGAAWAADAVRRWYGADRSRGPRWAEALAAGRAHDDAGGPALAAVVDDPPQPAIARATALGLLAPYLSAPDVTRVERALRDPDPQVRRAALGLLFAWDPARRWQTGAPLLEDPVRSVRLAAVDALADAAGTVTPAAAQRAAFERAVAEYRAAQSLNADRAESWLNLGSLDARLGRAEAAEAAYRRAITTDPHFLPAYVNLADLYRALGRDADGEAVLRQGLARADDPTLRYALGLLLVRQQRRDEALAELRAAAQADPGAPRYAYVYALALDGAGRRPDAIAVLEAAHRRATGDRDILAALVSLTAQSADTAAAQRWGAALRQLERSP
jgi:predicted CXXCH cytochrome family protein